MTDIQRQAFVIAAMALIQQAEQLAEDIENQKDRGAVTDAILMIGLGLYNQTRGEQKS